MSDPTTTEKPTESTETNQQTQGEPAEQLGEGGKKALEAERAARKAAEAERTELQKQIDAINQANESAVEKAQRESNEFKAAAEKATAEALRLRVATKHGISEEDADLFLTGSDAETLERQAVRLADRTPNSTTAGPRPDLSQGSKGGEQPTDKGRMFADFLNQTA